MKLATVTRSFAKGILAAFLAAACTAEAVIEEQAPVNTEPVLPMARPGLAVVEFDDTLLALAEEDLADGNYQTKSAPLNAALQEVGIVSLRRVFPHAGEYEPRTRREGLHRFYRVQFSGATPVTKALSSLSDVPGIVSARPVRKVRQTQFDDPLLSRQWHFVNTSYTDADINVSAVWDLYTVGSSDVVVSVVDGGVWAAHPDLAANMWDDGAGHFGYNFVRNNYNIKSDGHGTHVAGIISAVNNNAVGVAGIAGGNGQAGIPGVRIMSCSIFEGSQAADDDLTARAIKWGADHGAVISSNSWGYYADGCLDGEKDGQVSDEELALYKQYKLDGIYKAAIDYFTKYAGCDNDGNQLPASPMKGGLVFFAAGNEEIDYDIISAYEPVLSVGAFGLNGGRASYSNYGDYVDIAAPGGNGYLPGNSIWSTVPYSESTSGYAGTGWAGTSMACPHASGVAALVASYFGGPGFTQETCRKIILGGLGKAVGGQKPIGKRLDALSIFHYGIQVTGGTEPDQPPVVELSQSQLSLHAHETVTLSVSVWDAHPETVKLSCQPGSDALVMDPASGQLTITGRNAPAGTYTAVITATNQAGLSAGASLEYTILPNHAPVVTQAQENLVLNREAILLEAAFRDPDGETLSLEVLSAHPDILQVSQEGSTGVRLSPVGSGVTTVTVTASDALGETAGYTFLVAVRLSSKTLEVYPVPASTVVYFWPDLLTPQPLSVTLYSATGSRVKAVQLQGSIFFPAPMDISALAPGRYTAVVVYGSATLRETVVKD